MQWQRKVGDGLGKKYIRLMPSVVADRIIAADGYGALAAFDRFTGKPIWQQQYAAVERTGFGVQRLLDRRDPAFVSGGVGVGEGLVLMGTTHGEVVACRRWLRAVAHTSWYRSWVSAHNGRWQSLRADD